MDAYIRIARTLLHLMFVALGVALVWYPAGGAASTSVLWVPAAKPWWDGGQKILHHYPSSLEFERLDLRQGMIIREYLCRRCSVLRHLSQKQKTASCKRLS